MDSFSPMNFLTILAICIPAGALTNEQHITIQPLTNTSPGGKGIAYRLTPHGQQFSKPVKIHIVFRIPEKISQTKESMKGAFWGEKVEGYP